MCPFFRDGTKTVLVQPTTVFVLTIGSEYLEEMQSVKRRCLEFGNIDPVQSTHVDGYHGVAHFVLPKSVWLNTTG